MQKKQAFVLGNHLSDYDVPYAGLSGSDRQDVRGHDVVHNFYSAHIDKAHASVILGGSPVSRRNLHTVFVNVVLCRKIAIILPAGLHKLIA